MFSTRDNRLNVVLLSGYLGSGKTSWLRHALFAGTFGNAQVFVQEAAKQPVDDLLLSRAVAVRVLTGKADTDDGRNEMVAALLEIAEARTSSQGGLGPNTLIIETSGLARPAGIIVAIREHPVLVHHFVLRETIIVSDAMHFRNTLESDVLCREQFLSADRIVISKSENLVPQDLSNIIGTMAQINPTAPIRMSTFGVESPVPALPAPTEIFRSAGVVDRPPTCVVSLPAPSGIDWIEFTVWLSALLYARGDRILRVKGVIDTDEGALLLQSVRKTMQQPEILPSEQHDAVSGDIVFIGDYLSHEKLRTSLFRFLAKTPPEYEDRGGCEQYQA